MPFESNAMLSPTILCMFSVAQNSQAGHQLPVSTSGAAVELELTSLANHHTAVWDDGKVHTVAWVS